MFFTKLWTRSKAVLFGLVLLCVCAGALPQSTQAQRWFPSSMTSMGDSITRAFNAGDTPFWDAPSNSWSTGEDSAVQSIYHRILAYNPAIAGANYNKAFSGSKVDALYHQAFFVNLVRPEFVTILIGANDACADRESKMTDVAEFRSDFERALRRLVRFNRNVQIYVVSIPDVYNLWDVLKDDHAAQFTWGLLGLCKTMLENPASLAPEDMERRQRVRQRIIEYNQSMAEVCATYAANCSWDENAVFNTPFNKADVSTRDYFHPSLTGQAKLAEVAWNASPFNR